MTIEKQSNYKIQYNGIHGSFAQPLEIFMSESISSKSVNIT